MAGLGIRLYQVQQREQENPDDIDKVPVKASQFDAELVLGAESAEEVQDQVNDEDHQPAEDVQGVEARHGEVRGRPQVAPGDREREVRVRVELEDALDEGSAGRLALLRQVNIVRILRLHVRFAGAFLLH